ICAQLDPRGQFNLRVIDGTGFFLDQAGTFLTARHVITDFLVGGPLADCSMAEIILVPNGAWDEIGSTVQAFKFTPTNCVISTVSDIAKCKTDVDLSLADLKAFTPIPVRFDDGKLIRGSNVMFVGFPLQNQAPVIAKTFVAGFARHSPRMPDGTLILNQA